MYMALSKTVKTLEKNLTLNNEVSLENLYKAYDIVTKLRSQLISIIYEKEHFNVGNMKLSELLSDGILEKSEVLLTINEPLLPLKELTASMQDHWIELIHAAIRKAAVEKKLPYFDKAFVWIEVITPKNSNNFQLWDTSNRAVNLIINNLKGIFFEDDNHRHMAFGVVGNWGEQGVTKIRIMSFDKIEQITSGF